MALPRRRTVLGVGGAEEGGKEVEPEVLVWRRVPVLSMHWVMRPWIFGEAGEVYSVRSLSKEDMVGEVFIRGGSI